MADVDKDDNKPVTDQKQPAQDVQEQANEEAPKVPNDNEPAKEGETQDKPSVEETEAKADDNPKPKTSVPTVPNRAKKNAPNPTHVSDKNELSGFSPAAASMEALAAKLERATFRRVSAYLNPEEQETSQKPAQPEAKETKPGKDNDKTNKTPDDLLKAGSEADAQNPAAPIVVAGNNNTVVANSPGAVVIGGNKMDDLSAQADEVGGGDEIGGGPKKQAPAQEMRPAAPAPAPAPAAKMG